MKARASFLPFLRGIGVPTLLGVIVTACGGGALSTSTSDSGASPAAAVGGGGNQLTSTPETDAATTGTVTLEDGGIISATARDGTTFELVVPAEAVAEDTEITMTPLLRGDSAARR